MRKLDFFQAVSTKVCQHGFWYWQPDQAIYDQGLKNLARMILQEL